MLYGWRSELEHSTASVTYSAASEPYAWEEEGKPYREFLVPAALVNAQGTVTIADEDDGKEDS